MEIYKNVEKSIIQIKKLVWILAILPLMSFEKKKETLKYIKTSFNSIVSVVSIKDLLECPREDSTLTIKNTKKTKYEYFLDGYISHLIFVNRSSRKSFTNTPHLSKRLMVKKVYNSDTLSNSDIPRMERKEETESRVTYQKKANSGKDRLRPEIQDAIHGLKNFSSPDIIITSTFRNWGGRGHRCGKAIDLNYTKTLSSWLDSKSGKEWLTTYNLEFFIEDYKKSSKETLNPEELTHWRWIPWATGIHVHINLK